jgi:hypothetical protein
MALRFQTPSRVFARRILLGAGVALTLTGNAQAQVVGFGGAPMTGWTPNGNTGGVPSVTGSGTSGDVLTLTTANNGVTSSYWFNTPQSITNFTESFTYQQTGSASPADGFAAVWQNQGTSAIGAGGGGVGYTPGGGNTTGGITSAAAWVGNIFSSNVIGAAYNNTVGGGNPLTIPSNNGVNIASGDPINVSLSYKESDGTLVETVTDQTTTGTYTRAWRGISI